jgi:hypothetical protein
MEKNEGAIITIEKPAPPAIVAELSPLVVQAKEYDVTDAESNGIALERLKALRQGERKIQDYFEPARKAADQAKKEIIQARDGLVGPIKAARLIYDGKADEYEREQRRIAQERERELQEKARKEEEERQLLAAIEAEESGDKQEAEAILAEPVEAPKVTVAPQVAKVEGVASATIWSAEVTDLHALIKYVAERPEWTHLLGPAMPQLNGLARSQRENMAIPGVKAVSRTSRRSR